jgi:hypothetical protein
MLLLHSALANHATSFFVHNPADSASPLPILSSSFPLTTIPGVSAPRQTAGPAARTGVHRTRAACNLTSAEETDEDCEQSQMDVWNLFSGFSFFYSSLSV